MEPLFAERYELLRELGEGGTAVVWEALDHKLGATRAIKMLSQRTRVGKARARLKAEAKAMAQLHHKHVLRVYDIGYADGRDFVVMDIARGSLHERLQEVGPLPPNEVVRTSLQVLSALEAAHTAGIVHRDVKPQNILLDRDGDALLADFGIALIDQDRFRSTRTGVAMGSLGFMAPEQRLDARSVDARADLYAMGCTMFNLLTGKTPIDLFTAGEDHERFSAIPAALRATIVQATRHNPDERFANAWDMSADLLRRLGLDIDLPTRVERPRVSAPVPTAETMFPEDYRAHGDTLLPPVYTPTREAVPPPLVQTEAVVESESGMPWLAVAALVGALLVAGAFWQANRGRANETPPTSQVSMGAVELEIEDASSEPVAESIATSDDEPEDRIEAPTKPTPRPTSTAPTEPAKSVGAKSAYDWDVSFGGKKARLILSGPDDALVGTMTVHYGQNNIATRVRGTLDGGHLSLEDVGDEDDLGRYALTLTDGRLAGSFSRNDGALTLQVLSIGP